MCKHFICVQMDGIGPQLIFPVQHTSRQTFVLQMISAAGFAVLSGNIDVAVASLDGTKPGMMRTNDQPMDSCA